ncbi:MAG: hypothetical protein RIF33_01155 [Cyclobacteriaceae bacterium]
MKELLFPLVLTLLLPGCSDDDTTSLPSGTAYQFENGFETVSNDLAELFPSDGSRWSNIQLVDPNGGENTIELVGDPVSEGSSSLRVVAKTSNEILSKADIEKGGFNAPEGSTVIIEANFYIASTVNIENLLLIDLECCSCWDPSVPDNQCPGIRLMMKSNDYLSIERGKILGTTLIQTVQSFPRNEWVNVKWELTLSTEDDGLNKLSINDTQVINIEGINMPNPILFREEFARNGINFKLQQPLFYERFQIGATANPTSSDIELFIDDVRLQIQ